jgi:MoxR-like ATPase
MPPSKTPRLTGSAGPNPHLPALGVYGFDAFETVIFASLVTEDPLLLIGKSGTGKTFLLNSLSEALGLEHRHYNASLISFDDLVGFPYPNPDGEGVRFLETPATVWSAESVLVDEISRCKPEHQNRLFSLVHERRIQGIRLERLRFRWAAMNPCSSDQNADDGYAGSEPLDPALGDRFGLIVPAADWSDLSKADRTRIADPSGEGVAADDGGWLRERLPAWRAEFEARVATCPPEVIDYATAAVTTLLANGVRVSPRRARFLTRSLLAAEIVADARSETLYSSILACTLPHQSWGAAVEPAVARLAHRAAWDTSMLSGPRKFVHQLHLETSLAAKLQLLLDECPNPETGTQAIAELLGRERRERAAAFAFAVYPAAAQNALPMVGREGINDLGKHALPVLNVNGEVSWQESLRESKTTHPEIARFAKALKRVRGARLERGRQFFNWCLVEGVAPEDPSALEREIEECVKVMGRRVREGGRR